MRRRPTEREAGFTLLEVLVAIVLFAIVVVAILAPLTGLFGMSQRSSQQSKATTAAQQVMEQIRGQWLVQANYDQICVSSALPYSATATVLNEDINGNSSGSATMNFSCGSNAVITPIPPLRRITVNIPASYTGTSTGTGSGAGVAAQLTVEVARP
ncbi:type IV pilus modification PilV family protein [Deinococcus sp.]|uniref:type IV pilus modification PilV family protein n=1 Tax=Deinococcus sp. TaxID=47478 RepID=UPI003CC60B0F